MRSRLSRGVDVDLVGRGVTESIGPHQRQVGILPRHGEQLVRGRLHPINLHMPQPDTILELENRKPEAFQGGNEGGLIGTMTASW